MSSVEDRGDSHNCNTWADYIERRLADALSAEREFNEAVVGGVVGDLLTEMHETIAAGIAKVRRAAAPYDGRSFTIRGTYAAGTDYKALDAVVLNGGMFIAKRDNPGACPGDGWQLSASQGKRGPPGPQGEPGKNGRDGSDAAQIVRWQIDRERYLAVPILSGDRTGPELNLRPLFEQFQKETR